MERSPSHLHPTVAQYVNNPQIADGYDSYFAGLPLFAYDCTFIEEYLKPDSHVLDIGCGTGRHLVWLHTLGHMATGMDLSPHMLQQAEKNLRINNASALLVQADFHALPFAPDTKFDCILLMFSVLGMVTRHRLRQELLSSLYRHLRPGGVILAHVHNFHHSVQHLDTLPRRWLQKLAEWGGLRETGDTLIPSYRGLQPLYLHTFTRAECRDLFVASGYRLLEIRPLNETRDAEATGENKWETANGFLIAAAK